ncbi:hypothetical protein [Erythrobacter sp. SD-21]|uniref:hypothetical protein n=1 Tax=Erythrobacter sp. SD-21 TaxID=161528 RepID=UPI000153FB34|nr:hypothetical protein [Erythrobacter sp. SD-21]EDL49700.1 hypothetical protein ED21_18917 [Erythrobacter sp. SD-21]
MARAKADLQGAILFDRQGPMNSSQVTAIYYDCPDEISEQSIEPGFASERDHVGH